MVLECLGYRVFTHIWDHTLGVIPYDVDVLRSLLHAKTRPVFCFLYKTNPRQTTTDDFELGSK